MTRRHRLAGRLRASIFMKILVVFIGGFTAIGMYLMASFWLFDWQQSRLSVRRTAMNYAELVLAELSDPPDTAAARAIADRLSVDMRIEGPGLDWSGRRGVP
jgi:hypothetical protein